MTDWQAMAQEALEQARETWGPVEGLVYRGPADFVLQHGRWYTPTLADQLAPKQCYGNALLVAGTHPGARYVEGYAVSPRGDDLIPHAWVAIGDASYEITWRVLGLAYIGVEFAWERADDATWEGDACVLDDFNRGWPLFRERWVGEPDRKVWPDNVRLSLIRAIAEGRATVGDYVATLTALERELA